MAPDHPEYAAPWAAAPELALPVATLPRGWYVLRLTTATGQPASHPVLLR